MKSILNLICRETPLFSQDISKNNEDLKEVLSISSSLVGGGIGSIFLGTILKGNSAF